MITKFLTIDFSKAIMFNLIFQKFDLGFGFHKHFKEHYDCTNKYWMRNCSNKSAKH